VFGNFDLPSSDLLCIKCGEEALWKRFCKHMIHTYKIQYKYDIVKSISIGIGAGLFIKKISCEAFQR
jgi:hypothetical protein